MKSTLSIIGIATLALFGLSTEALAEGRGPRNTQAGQCLSALPLSYHQERQIDGFRATAFRQSNLLRVQIDQAEAQLRFLTLMRRPSPIAIAHKEAELHALRDREQSIWSTYKLQVQAVMGPMQRMAWYRCSDRGLAPAGIGPSWNNHPSPVVVAQAPSSRPIAPSPRPMARR